ncbi:hypothetical protein [Janibacter sp. GS2]|uniref:hypothetical protein n=1 Tax=Janibacter sp. GS2 TaxID=3442646 RepID=UPI003EB8C5A9
MAERQHPDERDVDAIFESMVARWDDPSAAEAHGASPATGDVAPRRQTTGDVHLPSPRAAGPGTDDDPPAAVPEPVPWRTDPTHSVADALLGNDDDPGLADDDEGFTPPAPAPLPPASDRLFWGALIGLVLGPLGLIWTVIVRPGGFWPKAVVIALIVGGFACLVLRQPRDRGYDPDQGARV